MSFRGIKWICRDERGATMVEFSIASIVLFGLIIGTIDLALGMRNQSTLAFETVSYARQAAVMDAMAQGPGSCTAIADALELQARSFFQSRYGSSANVQFTINPLSLQMNRVQLSSQWEQDCFFCKFFPTGLRLRGSGEAQIEGAFSCS